MTLSHLDIENDQLVPELENDQSVPDLEMHLEEEVKRDDKALL